VRDPLHTPDRWYLDLNIDHETVDAAVIGAIASADAESREIVVRAAGQWARWHDTHDPDDWAGTLRLLDRLGCLRDLLDDTGSAP
jgi:hypothetical protein